MHRLLLITGAVLALGSAAHAQPAYGERDAYDRYGSDQGYQGDAGGGGAAQGDVYEDRYGRRGYDDHYVRRDDATGYDDRFQQRPDATDYDRRRTPDGYDERFNGRKDPDGYDDRYGWGGYGERSEGGVRRHPWAHEDGGESRVRHTEAWREELRYGDEAEAPRHHHHHHHHHQHSSVDGERG